MKDGQFKEFYVFSPFLRIFHWLMVGAVVVLFLTGLYIGNPFFLGSQGLEPTFAWHERLSMETIRLIHFSAAFVLVSAFILRIYGFVINKGDRLFPHFWKKEYYKNLLDITRHYLFLQYSHKPYLRNPLARASYVGVYVLLVIEAVTGFAMLFKINPNGLGSAMFGWINSLLGDEYVVHIVHHYVAWLIVLFVIVHVYMASRADFMDGEGEISSMFSGKKFLAHQPVDVGDIADEADNSTRHREHSITG